ncbi:hypothetical protein [uncultured Christiangramia sp.]|uniref:hypothetical protein n=1 Tax=uncultured Christiangramia sp. TaxID=503836 RepID=UPI002635EC54|nr:hypothetical protein [uncultured Christiangramia sp.]
MKKLIILLVIMMTCQGYAQDTIGLRRSRKYIPKTAYLAQFKSIPDTVDVRYIKGDSMVQVPMDYDPFRGKKQVRYEPKDSAFLNTYKAVVYDTENKVDSSRFMRYWKDELRIYFDKSVPEDDARFLMNFAEKLSREVDSLKISRNFIREKSNYIVYYLNEDHKTEHEPRIGNKSGYYVSWNGKSQIYKASLKVNTAVVTNNLLKENLLKYHFFKSLGYFASSKDLNCESILSACNSYRRLSDEDLELLKYHYSYGVCKGQSLKSFTQLTNSMQEKLKEDPNAQLFVIHAE